MDSKTGPGLAGGNRFSLRCEVGVAMARVNEASEREGVMIVMVGVGARECCEDIEVKGSTTAVSVLLMCEGPNASVPI